MKTVFKVPIVPPPKTPEAVPLEETPSRGTGKKSCSILFSSSGDMSGLYTSGMDFFDNNMDDQRSSVVKVACLGRSQSDCSKIMQIRLSTNQMAAFAHLHKQNGVKLGIFGLDQSEGQKKGCRDLSRI